jgi:hypothetical protein
MIGKSLYQLNNSPFFNIPKGNNLSFLLDLPREDGKMNNMKTLLVKISLAFIASTSFIVAQNTVNYNLNAMVIQGEASGGSLISDDIALGLGFGYDFPFANPRIEFAVKFDYLWINVDYIHDVDPQQIHFMRGTMHHLSATGGINIYLNKSSNLANLYQPFRPYTFILTGLAMQSNSIESSPGFDFNMVEGMIITPMLEIGGGAKIRINPHWSFNLQLGLRTTFSDDVDGLVGNTGAPDILGIFRIGVSKRL